MRIVFIHPNYRSGGAEIAGNWPPAWVAYLAGHLRKAGFDDIHFIDAMTHNLPDEEVASARWWHCNPMWWALLRSPRRSTWRRTCSNCAVSTCPEALRVMGGIHATFMYKQVLSEAPWVDVIVRGEGEEIFLELMEQCVAANTCRLATRYAASPSAMGMRSSPPAQLRPSRISMRWIRTGRCWSGTSTSTFLSTPGSLFRIWRAAVPLPALFAPSGNSGVTTGYVTQLK